MPIFVSVLLYLQNIRFDGRIIRIRIKRIHVNLPIVPEQHLLFYIVCEAPKARDRGAERVDLSSGLSSHALVAKLNVIAVKTFVYGEPVVLLQVAKSR